MIRRWQIAAGRALLWILLASTGVGPVRALTETYWQHQPATPGDWFAPGNWTNGLPAPDYWAYVNNGGVVQIGDGSAKVRTLRLGFTSVSRGAAELSDTGEFSAQWVSIGYQGVGRFTQNGGSSTINNTLSIGGRSGGHGTYELSGTGILSAAIEYLGYRGVGRFEQTGGSHTVSYLYVNPSSQYVFSGGSLQIMNDGGLNLTGTFDLTRSPVTIRAGDNTLVNLSAGSVLNASQASLDVGSNSLTIHAPTFDPAATFASFSTTGMVHRAGTDLLVSFGQGFSGSGVIADHVRCEGTIIAANEGSLRLLGGLTVSSGANVDLGGFVNLGPDVYGGLYGGTLLVNDEISGMSGGQLSAVYVDVGSHGSAPGTGRFVQTGGTASVHNFSLGLHDGAYGEYQLRDSGQLSAEFEVVGSSGAGRFVQTGGTNGVDTLCLAYYDDAVGTYELSGNGRLSTTRVWLAFYGTAAFIQTGGIHTVSEVLEVGSLTKKGGGYDTTSTGSYHLSGTGRLSSGSEQIGKWGIGRLVHAGGTNTVSGGLSLGHEDGGSGKYELSHTGQLSANHVWVGHFGTGHFIHIGGSNSIDDRLVVGHAETGRGTYELGGAGVLSADLEFVGYLGAGEFLQEGGTNSIGASLLVGFEEGSHGTYQLVGTGNLSAADEHVGGNGSGVFIHKGGTNWIDGGLYLATGETGTGTYALGGTAQLSAFEEYIGQMGVGRFTHTGGTNAILGVLSIAPGPDGEGTYELSGTGRLSANWEVVGGYGRGRFVHAAGSNVITQDLSVGQASGGDGTYHLGGTGQLTAYFEAVGEEGSGRFAQTGGTNSVGFVLRLGGWDGSTGTYELSGDGLLAAEFELVGSKGVGHFIQTGGTNAVRADLSLGQDTGGDGTYHLGGTGELWANKQFVGFSGTGRFAQTGGSNAVCDLLQIGYEPGSHGTYTISGGSLATGDLSVDYGTLEIAHPAALVTVSNKLSFGADGNFAAVPRATIHMTGSAMENQSADPAALAGLSNLTLVFEGGKEDVDPVEIAGRDLGPVLAGFQDNFALGTVRLGGADVGMIRLADDFDNRPGWEGSEALYVWNLSVGPSSYLDLGGLNLYFLNGNIDPGATIVGGTPTPVPEPSSLTLLLLAVLALVVCTSRSLRKAK